MCFMYANVKGFKCDLLDNLEKKGGSFRGGPIFRTGFSILSAKGFRWVGASKKPVRKVCQILKTSPL